MIKEGQKVSSARTSPKKKKSTKNKWARKSSFKVYIYLYNMDLFNFLNSSSLIVRTSKLSSKRVPYNIFKDKNFKSN